MKKRTVKRITCAMLAAFMLMGMTGCGGQGGAQTGTTAAAGTETKTGASDTAAASAEAAQPAEDCKDTITIAIQYNPTGLDPTDNKMQDDFNIINAIYDTLVYRDYENDEYLPRLATSWEWNSDTTMLFHLRDDVYFTNGEKMTADDVAYSFVTSINSVDNKSFMEPFNAETTKAIDETTVQIGFDYPFSAALAYIASSRGGIVCKSVHEEIGTDAYAQAPLGTGMFIFDKWVQGDSITMHRNENYWNKEKMPAYENLIYRVVTEASVRAAEVESGGVDAAFDIVSNDFGRLKDNPNLTCLNFIGWTHTGLQMNAACEKFKDARVREALCISLDIPAIVKAVYGDYAQPCSGIFSSEVQDFLKCGPYEYDPERAKELLKEAGYENGLDINICLGHTGNIVQCTTLAQEYWKQVGINATIEQMEVGSMIERNNAGVNEFSSSFTTIHSGTAGDGLKKWSSKWVGALHMNDPYIDEMLEKGLSAMDPEERHKIYTELQQYMWDGHYEITMAFPSTLFVHSAKMTGLTLTPNAQILDYSTLRAAK